MGYPCLLETYLSGHTPEGRRYAAGDPKQIKEDRSGHIIIELHCIKKVLSRL